VVNILFQTIKEAVGCKDVVARFYKEPNRAGKVNCPFHNDKTPSLQVYDDGFVCFGCGASGDLIAFVAMLEGVKQYEAARLIGSAFGLPIDRPPSPQEQQRHRNQAIRRNAAQEYRELESRAFVNMADFRSRTLELIEHTFPDVPDDILPAAHKLPMIEYLMDTLTTGTAQERLDLLREGVIHQWARLT
jgi:DNA primase